AGLDAIEDIGQRIDQIASHRAADAAVGKLDDAVARLLDQKVVDAHLAEFVDDDRRRVQCRILQQPVEKGCLAGPEKAGEDRDRDGLPLHWLSRPLRWFPAGSPAWASESARRHSAARSIPGRWRR